MLQALYQNQESNLKHNQWHEGVYNVSKKCAI